MQKHEYALTSTLIICMAAYTPTSIYSVVETTPSSILIVPLVLLNISGFKGSKTTKFGVCGGVFQILASP